MYVCFHFDVCTCFHLLLCLWYMSVMSFSRCEFFTTALVCLFFVFSFIYIYIHVCICILIRCWFCLAGCALGLRRIVRKHFYVAVCCAVWFVLLDKATAIACGQEFLHEFWFQFPSSRAPVAFWIPGYDKTYTATQWYEHYWSSVQLNLDEGTVLAFICQCSSDCPVIPSQSCAGENANRPGPPSYPKQAGSTEATGPLSLTTVDAIACDVGHFVFCGLVGTKDRPKKTQGCTPDWHRTQLKGLQVMLLPGVNLSIRHLLPAGWEVMPGIPSAMLTPADTVLQVSAIVKVGKTLGGSQPSY